MYKIRTYNALAAKGLDRFSSDNYQVGPDVSSADALMLRSQKLQCQRSQGVGCCCTAA
jgi:D-3-phosphoglycerate dehydrogenase